MNIRDMVYDWMERREQAKWAKYNAENPGGPTIFEYVRKNDGTKIGVLAAYRLDNKIYIGWSRVDRHDTFNKDFGRDLAYKRISEQSEIPPSLRKYVEGFKQRCLRYYKGAIIAE